MANRDVNAVQFLVLVVASSFVVGFLVQDRVQSNGSFACLTVTNDQLSLATTNWDHRVYGLQASRHWFVNGFTWNNAGRFHVRNTALGCLDRAFAVKRVTKAVNDAAKQLITDGNVNDRVGALDCVTFFNVTVRTEDNNTNVVSFEVQGHALNTTGEFDHLAGLNIVQSVHTSDTVTNGQNSANFSNFSIFAKVLDLVL